MNNIKEIKLDKKRITIPKEFGFDPKTIVYPMIDPRYPEVVFLYSEDDFEEKANIFLEKLGEDLKYGRITQEKYNAYIRKFASECSFSDEELDSERRLTLDDQIIESLKLTDKVLAILEGNKIVLCKDEETYNEYFEKRKSK